MPKLNEINQLQVYYSRVGEEAGIREAMGKPFDHPECPRYLVELGRIIRLLPEPPARILDLGAGIGWTSVLLAKRGYHVTGQDICADAIRLAHRMRERYDAPTASFVVQDYESMHFRSEFDAAVFYDSLHHAEDEHAALRAAYDSLKPGGICITVEPGEGHATSGPTQDYIAEYGVTEKDMPPHHIIAVGRSVGFRSHRVYARDLDPIPALIASSDDPAPATPTGRPGRLRTVLAYAKKTARAAIKGTCREDGETLFGWAPPASPPGLRESAIVLLMK